MATNAAVLPVAFPESDSTRRPFEQVCQQSRVQDSAPYSSSGRLKLLVVDFNELRSVEPSVWDAARLGWIQPGAGDMVRGNDGRGRGRAEITSSDDRQGQIASVRWTEQAGD